jgi:hypothetical protein
MAANIYDVPDEIKVPNLNFRDVPKYNAEIVEFRKQMKQWCIDRMARANVTQEGVGETIQFPVADGYAEYIVAATKPLELIHLPIWDAYQFQYAHRLTKKDVLDRIKGNKALNKLFGGEQK